MSRFDENSLGHHVIFDDVFSSSSLDDESVLAPHTYLATTHFPPHTLGTTMDQQILLSDDDNVESGECHDPSDDVEQPPLQPEHPQEVYEASMDMADLSLNLEPLPEEESDPEEARPERRRREEEAASSSRPAKTGEHPPTKGVSFQDDKKEHEKATIARDPEKRNNSLRRRPSWNSRRKHYSSTSSSGGTSGSNISDHQMIVELVTGLKEPMNPQHRKRKEFLANPGASLTGLDLNSSRHRANSSFLETDDKDDIPQYRLRSSRSHQGAELTSTSAHDPHHRHNFWTWWSSLFSTFVNWSFKARFSRLLLILVAGFFLLTLLWAILVYAAGYYQPQCFYVGLEGKDFQTAGVYFGDAYYISWTTFSTVGYGLAGPSPDNKDATCLVLHILVALEAFCGVLYASFAGAVILGKVRRNQAKAHVVWSNTVVVRVDASERTEIARSRRLLESKKEVDYNSSSDLEQSFTFEKFQEAKLARNHNGFPVLEFRILNQCHHEEGSQIVNASVSVWTSSLADRSNSATRSAANLPSDKDDIRYCQRTSNHDQPISRFKGEVMMKTKRTAKGTMGMVSKKATGVAGKISTPLGPIRKGGLYPNSSHDSSEELNLALSQSDDCEAVPSTSGHSYPKRRKTITLTEDPDGKGLIPQMIYSKLKVESNHHPFFQDVWTIRHVLSEKSPLISDKAQKMIMMNGGSWPDRLCSKEMLKEHICFHEIMVSFQGMPHMYGATVFAQHVYDFHDVVFGKGFISLIQRDYQTRASYFDQSLLNETTEEQHDNLRED